MYSMKETARKITVPHRERRDEREAHREIPKGCPDRIVLDRDQQIPFVRERVHRQRLGRTTPNVQETQAVESRSGEALLFLLCQEHKSSQ